MNAYDLAAADAQAMVGFRNVARHQHQALDLDIVRSILERRLDDFTAFAQQAIALAAGDQA